MSLETAATNGQRPASQADGAGDGAARPVIEVSGLTKRYGEVKAVRGIDLCALGVFLTTS